MRLILEKHQIDKLRKTYERSTGTDRQLAQVVLLSNEGWSQSRIAKSLNLDVQTVISYLQEYLQPKPNESPVRKKVKAYILTPDQTAKLVAHIDRNPHISMGKMRQYIEEHFNNLWTESAVKLFLKKHNFSYRSKRVLHSEVLGRFGTKKQIYHSICGWFRNNQATSDNCTSWNTSAHKAR